VVKEDWLKIKQEDIVDLGGIGLLYHYDNSPTLALTSVYCDTNWQIWRFDTAPRNYWENIENQREFLEWVALLYDIVDDEGWYGITCKQYIDAGGKGLLMRYDMSPSSMLMTCFTNINWLPWKFETISRRYWENSSNQRQFFDYLAEKYAINSTEDWYEMKQEDIMDNGGSSLLYNFHDNSPSLALMRIYPDMEWQPWRFESAPGNYWDDMENQRIFFDWIFDQLEMNDATDWYQIHQIDIIKLGGGALLRFYHDNSHIRALTRIYPEIDWQPWRFSNVPKGHWENRENQLEFFDWIAEELNIQYSQDWYELLNRETLTHFGGRYLLCHHHGDMIWKALETAYPDSHFQAWKFDGNRWKSQKNNREDFMDWMEDRYGVSHPIQWYSMTKDRLMEYRYGRGLLNLYGGSLLDILRERYPGISWQSEKWMLGSSSRSHRLLYGSLRSLLDSNIELECEWALFGYKYVHESRNRPMQFDLWIPRFNIAMEYQGVQHFMEHRFVHFEEDMAQQSKRDDSKSRVCNALDIRLISIPFWWSIEVDRISDLLQRVLPFVCTPIFKCFLSFALERCICNRFIETH
jgi:hypothetical protein